MHILQVHNRHMHAGGEDVTVETERYMLERQGHTVTQWIVDNSSLTSAGLFRKAILAVHSLWSIPVYTKARKLLREQPTDLVHVHNTIPLISPSIYTAAHAAGVPVVQTLNNYRLICPASPLYRDGRLCEECIGRRFPVPAIRYACYRQSRLQTTFVSATLFLNKLIGTYEKHIDFFIAPNEFTRRKFIEGGLPPDRIAVKPHFVLSDFTPGEEPGNYVLYAGRLVAHKGFKTLLDAWRLLPSPIPLKIIGNGPLAHLLSEDLPPGVEYCGVIEHREMARWMRGARFFLFTSEWYEPFGYTIVESFASGRPVIGARIGNIPAMVREGSSGWLYEPGNPEDLARKTIVAWGDPVELQRRGQLARKQYEAEYRIEQNYPQLMDIYQHAMNRFKNTVPKR